MDIAYLLWLQKLRLALSSVFDSFSLYVTDFGMWHAALLVIFLLYWCIDKKKGELLIISMSLAQITNSLLMMIFCVYRPWIRDARVEPAGNAKVDATGYSFPSGHSTASTTYLGGASWLYRDHKVLRNCLLTLLVLVLFSRNYLGVHTPQDVLVGTATGVLCVFLGIKLLHWADQGKTGISISCVLHLLPVSSFCCLF